MLTLYGINLSTFTRKVRLALAERGIAYTLQTAAMGSPQVRALNPLGRIPVLVDGDVVVPDSSVIIAYLERACPGPALYPAHAPALARALWLEEYADTRLREATLVYFAERVVKPLFQGKAGDAAALAAAEPLRDEAFGYLEEQLAGGELVPGAGLTVADVAVGAQLITYVQAEAAIDAGRWPRLAAWLDRQRQRPAWAGILAEEAQSLAAARARRGG
ncbi:MAG: glutathione S-transferase family protein [Chromatiales bacterium]|jgi:glutathione S-transferase|nr:glutathione S-transferase family protein [Chromatiales bacterium]